MPMPGLQTFLLRPLLQENKIVLDILDQKLWSPDSPFLYDLKVQIKKGDTRH